MEKCTDPKWASEQLTKEEAIKLHDSKSWETWTPEQVVRFQLFQKKLCIPFDKFHEAIEKVLNRPVWTHEFAFRDEIVKEYLGEKETPSFDDIINLIPEEKRLIIGI